MRRRYTKELLEPIVAESLSISEVCRKLGLARYGGSWGNIKLNLIKFGISFEHFKGLAVRKGVVSEHRKDWQERLVVIPGPRTEKTHVLRRALLASGRSHVCSICGLLPTWNDQQLVLQIDHINGDRFDNRSSNLRFLCPNCHSQTLNWGCKNSRNSRGANDVVACMSGCEPDRSGSKPG